MTKLKNTAPIIDMPSKKQLEKATRPYSDDELTISPALQNKIEELMQFFDQHNIDYSKFKPEHLSFLTDKKKAYPNQDQYNHIPGQHNTQKWLHAVREIYKKEQGGSGRVKAIRQITSGWKVMETYDFLNWLKFYEGGNHLKYKMAQLWYENGAPGYFLPIKPDPAPEPSTHVSGGDIDFAKQEAVHDEEKRQLIEKQRNKIIGRLDSAEKLLRSPDGQAFAGPEFEILMEAIYQLKKKIHMVNKLSSSVKLYEDMIVREANILARQGYMQAAELLFKTAQANNPPPPGIGTKGDIKVAPAPVPPDSPSAPMSPGAPGGLPSMGPGMPQNAPSASAPETGPNENSPTNLQGVPTIPAPTSSSGPASPMPQEDSGKITNPGLAGFLENLDQGKNTAPDNSVVDDALEVKDAIEVEEKQDYLMVTEAQMAIPPLDEPMTTDPAPAPLNPGPPAPKMPEEPAGKPTVTEEPPLEVTEDEITTSPEDTAIPEEGVPSNFDAKIDAVFADTTIADIVAKLEKISKSYRTREMPRELAFVDMMMNSKGIASFFPSLSEATNKALEANNYISTRVDDILSKLRGAMSSKESDLKGKLQEDADKEKARKQQRKDQEAAELAGKGKEKPEVEIEEDLGPKPPAVPAPPRPASKPLG